MNADGIVMATCRRSSGRTLQLYVRPGSRLRQRYERSTDTAAAAAAATLSHSSAQFHMQ